MYLKKSNKPSWNFSKGFEITLFEINDIKTDKIIVIIKITIIVLNIVSLISFSVFSCIIITLF